jgi:ABC-2 type transport system ATP-binding protein
VLVLDEPVTGLDRQGQKMLHDVIRRLGREGRTVLVASHDLTEIEEIADTITLVARGKVLVTDTADGVRSRLGSVRVSFIGDEAALHDLRALHPVLDVTPEAGGRLSVLTDQPDQIARVILNACEVDRQLRVHDRTLAEALDALLDSGASA